MRGGAHNGGEDAAHTREDKICFLKFNDSGKVDNACKGKTGKGTDEH